MRYGCENLQWTDVPGRCSPMGMQGDKQRSLQAAHVSP